MKENMYSIPRTLLLVCALVLVGLVSTSKGESHEGGCDLAYEQPCRTNSSLCVPLEHVGDGYIDCPDGSDEDCPIGWFVCNDMSDCISTDFLQDGVPDCYDESDEECDEGQHECLCGFPRCIDLSLVGDGNLDCIEGSDELAIDKSSYICPSEFAETQEIRRKRRQTQERVRPLQPSVTSTTTTNDENPTGLLSSTVGTFINDGTTTEYVTLVHGTNLSPQHYTQVTSTSSRVFFAVPTRLLGSKPEGLISTKVQTQVKDSATTVLSTNYVRTHIDGTYAELIETVTDIHAPISSSPTAAISIPIQGTFTETIGTQNAKLEVNLLNGVLSPEPVGNKVVTLMGTKGQFVKDGLIQPTTYNVFTGSYVNDQRTYLFFFGNTALPIVTKTENEVHSTPTVAKEVIFKQEGDRSKIMVDMEKELHVIMPSKTHSIDSTKAPDLLMGEGMINGHVMEGVFIEGSEGFEMEGAKSESLDTSMVTITIGRPVAHTRVIQASSVATPVEVTILSMEEKINQMNDVDNEIDGNPLRARKVLLTGDEIIADLKPSQARKINLPTFTVNQVNEPLEKILDRNIEKSVESSISESYSENVRREGKSLDDIRARFNLEVGGIDSDLPTVTYVGFADFTTTIADTVVVFTPRSKSPNQVKSEISKTKNVQSQNTLNPVFSSSVPEFTTLVPRLATSRNSLDGIETKTKDTNDAYSTIVTHRYNSVDLYPTGLVSSIGGTIVMDDMTTLLTTYVYGTYINDQYAQVVESTSSIFYLVSRSATHDIKPSNTIKIMATTEISDIPEITTEFYDLYDYDYDGSVTEGIFPIKDEIVDNNIGRSVASSPDQQLIIDIKDKKGQQSEPTATQPQNEYTVSTFTSYLTYFRDGETTISTILDTSSVFLPFFKTEPHTVQSTPTETSTVHHITSTADLTTLTYYTTLFVDGVTKISSRLQVVPQTAGSSELKPTSTAKLSTSTLPLNKLTVVESVPFDDYEFTTEGFIESYTESISESMSELSTDSSAQDVTESPGFSLDSSLNPDGEVNAVFFPRTYYTTYTYFTTYYRSETSTIVSSLETLTNVVSDFIDHEEHKTLTPVVPTYPVTYYTTYTYWTTFFKGNQTLSTSTEETLSSVATPALNQITMVSDKTTLDRITTASSPIEIQSTPAVTTFYTTYTYYTSTYIGDSTIVSSRLNTVTNVVTASSLPEVTKTAADKSTGLLSTIRGSTIIDGTTTIFSTNIIGTIIDGLYAQIQSTTSQIINPSSPFFLFPSTSTSKESTPFFTFSRPSEESTKPSTPFFIFPSTTKENTPLFTFPAIRKESISAVDAQLTFEGDSITERPIVSTTPALDSSIIDSTSEIFNTLTATEALPDSNSATEDPAESIKSELPIPSRSKSRVFGSSRERPDIYDVLRRFSSSTRGRSSTITRDGVTPTVTATSASGADEDEESSGNRVFRFGFLSSSSPSSSRRFRFKSSRAGAQNSGPASTSGPQSISSSNFRFASSTSRRFAGSSSPGGNRFSGSSTSVLPGRKNTISPSSVFPKVTATSPPESNLDDTKKGNNPEQSFRPFNFRPRSQTNSPRTRDSIPFSLLNRRPSSGTSRAESPISRFTEATKKKPDITPAKQTPAPRPSTTVAPKKSAPINRLSLEERRQNRFRQSRPDLSKLFRRRNPFKKDLDNEATELEAVYVEADGRILSPEEVEAILADEVLTRQKRQVNEFGARTTSRGNSRSNRQSTPTSNNDRNTGRGSRLTARQVAPSSPRESSNSQFTLSNNRARRPTGEEPRSERTSDTGSVRRSTSRTSLPQRPRASSRTRSGVPLGNIRGRGFRRPATDNSFRTSSRFAPSRPTSSPIRRPRPSSNRATSRRPSVPSRSQQTNPIANFRNRPSPTIPTEAPAIFPSNDGGFLIQDELTITREVPTKATIPLVENGKTIQKEVITASFQTEVIQPNQITQTEIDGAIKLLLSTIDGGNEITHYIIEPMETTSVTFTKTFIGGRRTSVEHILPTTAYNLVTVTKAKGGGDLQQLLQLLLGQQQQQNPLLAALGLGQQVPSEVVHTTTYVTTVTKMLSTVIPVIFRGKTIETTIIEDEIQVITATELSTQTVLGGPSVSPFNNAGSLNQLLPLLLQGQLQQQSPQIRPTREPSLDTKTVSPQLLEQLLIQQQQQKQIDDQQPQKAKTPSPKARPVPAAVETSIVTLFVSGRKPGEFSTLLSTVTLGGDSTRIKRGSLHTKDVQATVLPHYIETDKGLFQLPKSYHEDDMDWFIMSAINEIDTSDVNKVTPSLDSVIGDTVKYLNQQQVMVGNDTHSFNNQPFLWEGPAELAPLKRTIRSAQRGNNEGVIQRLSNIPSARKIQDGTPQQIIEDGKERPVLGQFNVPGLRFQSRLISEQVKHLQPPTTYYTTFTYYTTLVDEIGQEFVQSSEETMTQIATNGNVRFDDFTKTIGESPLATSVPLQARFTLDDAIIPGMPRPVPDPVFPEPPPPFGPVVKHFGDVQPFQPVPQQFVPEEFRIQENGETLNLPTARRVEEDILPLSPQLIAQPARHESGLLNREVEPLAASQKPRRVVLTRKRPVQSIDNQPLRVVKNRRPINSLPSGSQVKNAEEGVSFNQNIPIEVLQQDVDFKRIIDGSNQGKDETLLSGNKGEDSIRRNDNRRPLQVTANSLRSPNPSPISNSLDTSSTTFGGRRKVVVTRRLPQPTVVASRLHPLVATVDTYYTVYSYLYTLYEGSTPFSTSTREVTVSNQIEPTVVSVLPKFQTGTAVEGFYTLEMGGATATLGERVIDSLTTQIFLASATLVELSPEDIKQNSKNLKQSAEKNSQTVRRPSQRQPQIPAVLQSSLIESGTIEATNTPFLTTSTFRATKARNQVSQRKEIDDITIPNERTVSRGTPSRAGVRNRGRGTVRFEDSRKRNRFTVTRRRPVTPATSEPVQNTLREETRQIPGNPVRSRGRLTPTVEGPLLPTVEKNESPELSKQPIRPSRPGTNLAIEGQKKDRRPTINTFRNRERPESRFTQNRRPSIKEDQDQLSTSNDRELASENPTAEQELTVDVQTEISSPKPTPTQPTRPPRKSIRRDDIPIIRRPDSERSQKPRPFITQEELTTPGGLRFTPSPKENTTPNPIITEDSKDLHVFGEDDYYYDDYYEDYYYYENDYAEETQSIDPTISQSKTGPNLVRPTQLTITSNTFDIIEALKRERTYTQIVAPTRSKDNGSRRRTRPQIEASTEVSLPSDVVYSTYATTTLLPILGGEHSITLTILTSTLVTLAEDQLHLITESPELFNPALVTDITGNPSLSVPSLLLPTITSSKVVDSQPATITTTIKLPGGEVITSTIVEQSSRAFGFFPSINQEGSGLGSGRAVVGQPGSNQVESLQSSQADPGDQRLGARFSVGARHNLATKVMSNGVEVIVAGDKTASKLPPEQVISNNFEKFRPISPITLPPSTLSDQMLLFSSQETDHPKVTQLAGGDDGHYQTHTYFTTYTYYNTLLAGNKPFVITSKQTVDNLVTVPLPDSGNFIERTEVIFDTQTYYTTQTFTRTVGQEAVTSQEILTQVVITEASSVQRATVQPTRSSIVTKTYFTTLTYYNTALQGDRSVISTDTVVSSEVITETTYITGTPTLGLGLGLLTLTTTPSLQPASVIANEEELILYATKTHYTTLTYLTTILEGSETITASHIEISSNIITESLVSATDAAELQYLKNSYISNQLIPTATTLLQPKTISYMHIRDNLYKQLRTFFATFTHYTTLNSGQVNSRVEVQTKVLTSTITTTSVPASLLINPTAIFSTQPVGATSLGSGSSIQLDPSYLASLKNSHLAAQSTTAASKPGDKEGLQATVLVEGDNVSGTFVVSDSTTSATLLVRPTDEPSTSVLTGQTVVIFDSSYLSSLKSSYLSSPTASPTVKPTPIITTDILDSSTVLVGIDGETTTLGPGDPVVVVVPAAGENETVLPDIPLTVRPAVFPIPAVVGVPSSGSVDAAVSSGTSGESSGSGSSGGVSITGSSENGLNIDLGPMLSAVAGILRNNLNSQIASSKSDENRRKVNTPLRPSNTIVSAEREPLLIPVGGVGASLSSSRDQTEGAEHVFIPLRRPNNAQGQPRFPSRPTPTLDASTGFINISPAQSRPNINGQPIPIHISDMQGFGPTFLPPKTESGFTAITKDSSGPTRVSIISGTQTIFFGGVDIEDLPPPGQPAQAVGSDRTTVVLQPTQAIPFGQTRPVPVPVKVPQHNQRGSIPPQLIASLIPDQEALGDSQSQFIFSRPSPKMPQPSRVGPKTIVSIEGDNRIVRTQVINAQPVDQYYTDTAIIVAPPREDFVLQSTVGVGIISGVNNGLERPQPPKLEGTVLPGSETVVVGQGFDNGRTTVVRGSSTVLSGATTIFGSLFTRPAENNEPKGDLTSVVIGQGGKATRFITRKETSARTVTATQTDVIFTAGITSTLTKVIRSTLPLRTVISTIIGTSTNVNYVTATANPDFPNFNNNFGEDDPTTYPPGSPFDPANYPSFPPNPRPIEGDLRLPGDAEVVLSEASLGIAEDNEISRVVESQSPDQEINVGGPLHTPISKCSPQCSAARKEVCKHIRGEHTCVCRAGYARRNRYDSCKPSVAYSIKVLLDGYSDTHLRYDPILKNSSHPITQELANITIRGFNEAMMASQLSPHYHSATVTKFTDTRETAIPASGHPTDRGVVAEIKVELSKSQGNQGEEEFLNELKVQEALELSLRESNFSLGGTEIFANREVAVLASQDFDECSFEEHNDCSSNAHCFNIAGSYLCTCKEGYKDMSDMPGRACAVKTEQCSFCSFQGECITNQDGSNGCRCLQWFSGERCQLNLKVMLIVLVTVGSLLVLLLFLCLLLCCIRSKKNANKSIGQMASAPTFLRARGTGMASTLDRRAMIQETSSESSMEHSRMHHGTSFLAPKHADKPDRPMRPTRADMTASRQSNASFNDDRSVGVHTTLPPVLIPRVKGPAPRRPSVVSRGENGEPRVMIGADARSDLANSQQNFIDLLEQQSATLPPKHHHQDRSSRRESLTAASVHGSNIRINRSRSHSREHLDDSFLHHQLAPGSMRSRSSDRLHHGSSHDINSEFGVNFSFRDGGERTMSVARSYDETTVRPPVRTIGPESFYSSKALSSQHISDEHQTMAERDGGSTVVYPQTELYRPVRDTDSLSDMSDHNSKVTSSRAASRSFFS